MDNGIRPVSGSQQRMLVEQKVVITENSEEDTSFCCTTPVNEEFKSSALTAVTDLEDLQLRVTEI